MNKALDRTQVVAEAGVNHNGSIDHARRLIEVAAEAGADAVKFQMFRADRLVTLRAPKAQYQERMTGRGQSQREMLRPLELSRQDHKVLFEHCEKLGIQFLSTPFDSASARYLAIDLGLATLKISSGDITNGPLLLTAARLRKRLILSTGMCTLGEVERALGVVAFGLLQEHDVVPRLDDFCAAFESEQGRDLLSRHVTLLHCTTEYPAPYETANLRAMDTLRQAFHIPTGLSDHTPGIVVPLAAAARGAAIIEKHFTLDRNLPGPDHAASLEADELRGMIRGIRRVEQSLGTGYKIPCEVERENRPIVRRGLVARRGITKGHEFVPEDLVAKRPSEGLSPMYYWSLLGTAAQRDYAPDDPIRESINPEGF